MSDKGMRELTDLERMLMAERDRGVKLLESAWGIIANAGGSDWTRESAEWREAAARWRDDYFKKVPQS
jgi:hypothetical protein